jgi:hypothetical protein
MNIGSNMQEKEQIIEFDGKEYKYSELSERGKIIINQLNVINYDISECKLQLDRHEAAKQMFILSFKHSVDSSDKKDEEKEGDTNPLSLVSSNKLL